MSGPLFDSDGYGRERCSSQPYHESHAEPVFAAVLAGLPGDDLCEAGQPASERHLGPTTGPTGRCCP